VDVVAAVYPMSEIASSAGIVNDWNGEFNEEDCMNIRTSLGD